MLQNRKFYGFFHHHGVKQGDLLSLSLFILYIEVLSRDLNALFAYYQYVGYDMPKWSPNQNHLAYPVDTIIF